MYSHCRMGRFMDIIEFSHPTRYMIAWKGSGHNLKDRMTQSTHVINFHNTSSAVTFYKRNKARLKFFIPDIKMKLVASKPDTLVNLQWYLEHTEIKRTWNYTYGRDDILIAVIDSGFDFNNTETNSNIYNTNNDSNINLIGYNFGYVCCDNTFTCHDDCICRASDTLHKRPMDTDGHGTSVSGIVGAGKDNGGIIGVAPYIKILPIKITDCNGDIWSSSVISAIEYAINMKVNILTCSFGDIYPYQFKPPKTMVPPRYHKTLTRMYKNVIKKAYDGNIVVIASAGNENIDLDYLYERGYSYLPCLIGRELSNVICVGAAGKNGYPSPFSNYGNKSVQVWAPGEDIFTTGLNNEYIKVDGTSYSTPIVSGIVALGLSHLRDINKTVDVSLLRGILVNSTGKGVMLDSYKFIRGLLSFKF